MVSKARQLAYNSGSMTKTDSQPQDATRPLLDFHPDSFYSLPVHLRMLNDTARTLAWQKAIENTITPDDIVLDIGTGNGILAATAARCGAKHVYAVEYTEFIEVARSVFKKNGLEDKITLIRGSSLDIDLPQKATVLVSEIIGNDPFDEGIIHTFNDAKERLLTPDAQIIPQGLQVFAYAAEMPAAKYGQYHVSKETLEHWHKLYHIDFSPFLELGYADESLGIMLTNEDAQALRFLSSPIALSQVDFRKAIQSVEAVAQEFTIERAGLLNAVLLYFDVDVGGGVKLSIDPNTIAPSNSWNFPLHLSTPRQVQRGDKLTLHYALQQLTSRVKVLP